MVQYLCTYQYYYRLYYSYHTNFVFFIIKHTCINNNSILHVYKHDYK